MGREAEESALIKHPFLFLSSVVRILWQNIEAYVSLCMGPLKVGRGGSTRAQATIMCRTKGDMEL